MRLLNTKTLEFKEFLSSDLPAFAILSHRWRDGNEVTYHTFGSRETANKSGAAKIMRCCRLAFQRGLQWAWVDTCCINKESSAELVESINSMWEWYRAASECYVFLDDVKDIRRQRGINRDKKNKNGGWVMTAEAEKTLAASEWFERGWTLQELLAPKKVAFYNANWAYMGTKRELAIYLSRITEIGVQFLQDRRNLRWASVAMKMSWAARRRTTKLEDTAYCLLGLFDVNMPLMYGEGRKAFMRLQREIVDSTNDESIFAWRANRECPSSGLLATWPSEFRGAGHIMNFSIVGPQRPHYSLVNRGLELRLPGGDKIRPECKTEMSGQDGAHGGDSDQNAFNDPEWQRKAMYKYAPVTLWELSSHKNKRVQLTCGYCGDPSFVSQEGLEREAQQRVIWIQLKCVDGVWQRTDSHKFHNVLSGYQYRKDNVQDVFFVPQTERKGD